MHQLFFLRRSGGLLTFYSYNQGLLGILFLLPVSHPPTSVLVCNYVEQYLSVTILEEESWGFSITMAPMNIGL